MAKGFFSAGVMVLMEGPAGTESITRALAPFTVKKHMAAEPDKERNWMSGYESWTIPYRPEVNGYVVVDQVDAAWPDGMGDTAREMALFGAWSMGFFGPCTFPGNLDRAMTFASLAGREETVARARRNGAFLRVRASYILGADDDAKVAPEDYDPRGELEFVTKVALALLEVPGTLCYFNPGGETIYTAAELKEQLEYCEQAKLPALTVWSGVRVIRVEDAPPWMVADTVGMEQLDAIDHEVCYRRGEHEVSAIVNFARNAALYTFQKGPVIETGHTMDGPGGRWRALVCEMALYPGMRRTIRWFGPGEEKVPERLLRTGEEETKAGETKGFLGRVKSLFRKR